jgi:diaminopimelate epimerase
MGIHFYKYHGTGNDFILIDNRDNKVKSLKIEQIRNLCHRRFGIGADGLMLLKTHPQYHFEMDYYNSDGSGATMCGNGGRCITAFARDLGIIEDKVEFIASDGLHEAYFETQNLVCLKMQDINSIEEYPEYSFLNTGSPHYISFVKDTKLIDVFNEGKKVRYSDKFKAEGTNVNFVSILSNGLAVRTYERGVEDETFSCGTGSVAAAIAWFMRSDKRNTKIEISTMGGKLEVSFKANEQHFTDIYLKGPAVKVFEGEVEI